MNTNTFTSVIWREQHWPSAHKLNANFVHISNAKQQRLVANIKDNIPATNNS